MILETIAEATRKRVAAEKEKCSLAEMKEKATAMNPDTGFPFEQALKKPGMSFICEVKKASPSKGIIAEDFPYLEIAKEYEAAGASARLTISGTFSKRPDSASTTWSRPRFCWMT